VDVELIYDASCPNVRTARAHLLQAFARAGLPPRWREWEREAPDSPPRVRRYGSPTILVDGEDVSGAVPGEGNASCRLYADSSGDLSRVPPVEVITTALLKGRKVRKGASGATPRPARGLAAVLPASLFALLPMGTCPACWPAYLALLGTLGLGFLLQPAFLGPLTGLALAAAAASLAYRAKTRRGYGPFVLSLAASILVLAGKFALAWDPAVYAGIAALVGASIWNAWPRARSGAAPCPSCPAAETRDRKTSQSTCA